MVAKKKSDIQPLRADLPIYPIGVAAKLLDVHPRTLRIYEAEGLIRPDHQGARRLYSLNDIKWISCLRSMIHDQGISIPGIKRLLNFAPCWEIAECPAETHETCDAAMDWSTPRNLRQAGDKAAAKGSKTAVGEKKGCGQKKRAARN
jgi:MerR family transcriptional regulator, heat shock protein HspR